MPVYEYRAAEGEQGCAYCRRPFEHLHLRAGEILTQCPRCGAAVVKVVSAPHIGASQSGFDARARAGGFHKLKRLGKGEYEQEY